MTRPIALAALAAAISTLLPLPAQAQVPVFDCSQFTTSAAAFSGCMEGNRIANTVNRDTRSYERQMCISMIDQARALAARGDGRGWNRVPTRCLY
jgi:hypothetical protein